MLASGLPTTLREIDCNALGIIDLNAAAAGGRSAFGSVVMPLSIVRVVDAACRDTSHMAPATWQVVQHLTPAPLHLT